MTRPTLVVLGGSAGALDPLATVVAALPAAFPLPLAAVVHVPENFENTLPETLGARCAVPVCEAVHGTRLTEGVVLAPANYHLLIERDRTVALSLEGPVAFSRPSIDVLFESAAAAFGAGVLGIVLSGANEDGARGLAAIRRAGGAAWVQDPRTAAVPFMPEAALRIAGADRVLSPAGLGLGLAALSSEAVRIS